MGPAPSFLFHRPLPACSSPPTRGSSAVQASPAALPSLVTPLSSPAVVFSSTPLAARKMAAAATEIIPRLHRGIRAAVPGTAAGVRIPPPTHQEAYRVAVA